jgi:Mrp family chromosome partitioning ATPase
MQPLTNARPAEVWEKKASAPEPDEIVVSQPISTRWRMPAALTGGNGTLVGLRDQILEFTTRGPFVIAVTSEQACVAAKTNVAAKLSGMLSREDHSSGEPPRRVLLVEANFDFPALHRVLSVEMPPGSGFSQQLRSRLRNGRKPWSVVHCTTNLDVLAEGPLRSPGVLLSQEFANAIAELRTCYDVIVLDSPVAGQGVETKPIIAVSDGIAVIAASTSVLKAALDRAMNRFGQKKLMVAIPASETT